MWCGVCFFVAFLGVFFSSEGGPLRFFWVLKLKRSEVKNLYNGHGHSTFWYLKLSRSWVLSICALFIPETEVRLPKVKR